MWRPEHIYNRSTNIHHPFHNTYRLGFYKYITTTMYLHVPIYLGA
jgi:hypothetical protein